MGKLLGELLGSQARVKLPLTNLGPDESKRPERMQISERESMITSLYIFPMTSV